MLRRRTGRIDQAEEIARALGMDSHFHANVRVIEEQYGDAILTTLPSELNNSGRLPGRPGLRTIEPRFTKSVIVPKDAASGERRQVLCITKTGSAVCLAPGPAGLHVGRRRPANAVPC